MDSSKCWDIKELQGWITISIKDRIDSFNYSNFARDVETIMGVGSMNVAFELSQTRFLSFKAIQFLNQCAQQCRQTQRRAALVAPTEKLKRQIHIYADLEQWEVYRTLDDLTSNRSEFVSPQTRESPFTSL